MLTQVRQFFAALVFEDEYKTRVISLPNTILLALLATLVVLAIATLIASSAPVPFLVSYGILILLILGALGLVRRGRIQLAGVLFSSAMWVVVTLTNYVFGGVSSPGIISYMAVILIAGLFLGGRAGIGFAGVSVLAGLGMLYAGISGVLPTPVGPITPVAAWLALTANSLVVAVLLYLATRSFKDMLERARYNERALAESNRKLRGEITERKRAEEALQYRVEIEKLIAALLTNFINLSPDETNDGINWALQTIGQCADVDRGYVFLFYDNGTKVDNTHEWCAEGIEPQIENFQGLPVEIVPWWIEKLNRFEDIHIPRVADLPPEAEAEKEILQSQAVQSFILVPMVYSGSLVGFLGFDSVQMEKTWMEEDIALLRMVGEMIVNALERKRAEKALAAERALLAQRVEERTAELSVANAELARSARLKDEFLASMSHELRTPLNAILGMSEVLRREIYGPLGERQSKCVHTIEESGRHLLNLINDILDVSKIEAGKMELQIAPLSVELVCQASLQFVKQQAHKKRLKVSSNFDNAVTILQADERRLKQILVNLLSNAVKFTPEGGAIGLDVVGDTVQQAVHFTIWDTGIGIMPEDMGQLFKPFVQLDGSLSRQHMGTGLGLALVYRLTEMHGGSVSIESEVGKGSQFTISLPWRETESVEPRMESVAHEGTDALYSPPHASRSTSRAPLILLAEDNQANIDTMSSYLLAGGYRVIIARDGAEAIERAREETPDLILMDTRMPGMDGLEATRRLRADADLATIPIIALTALAMPGDRERCLAAGVNEYLSKPVSLKGLIETIEVQIGQEESGRQKAEGQGVIGGGRQRTVSGRRKALSR